jgi:hypothetical protein
METFGYVAGFFGRGRDFGAAQLYYDNYMVIRITTWDRASFTDAQRSEIQGKAYYDAFLEGTGLDAVALTARINTNFGIYWENNFTFSLVCLFKQTTLVRPQRSCC